MGRKTKLTPTVHERIVKAIRGGNYYVTAAAYAGVAERTFYDWMRRGEKSTKGIYFDFYQAVQLADAEATVRNVQILNQAAAGVVVEKTVTRTYWEGSGEDKRQVTETTVTKSVERDVRAAQFWLERKHRPLFGKAHVDSEAPTTPTGAPEDVARDIMQSIRDMDEVTAGVNRKPD
ncbi:MAG: hypothetical protein ACRENP_20610 [Longimicrobiales bacterium]